MVVYSQKRESCGTLHRGSIVYNVQFAWSGVNNDRSSFMEVPTTGNEIRGGSVRSGPRSCSRA